MLQVSFDTATSSLASEMINDAEAEINKWLSRRYDLSSATFQTSTSIPPTVRAMCNRLSEGYMWIAISRGGKESIARGELLIKQVMSNLKSLADYQADLVNTTGSVIADMSNTSYRVMSNTTDYTTTFNEDSSLNWAVDSDKLDDIETERD